MIPSPKTLPSTTPCSVRFKTFLLVVSSLFFLIHNGTLSGQENDLAQADGDEPVARAEQLSTEALALQDQGQLAAAEKKYVKAFDLYNEATRFQGADKGKYLMAIGDILQLQKKHQAAIPFYRRAIEFETVNDNELKRLEDLLDHMALAISNFFKPAFALAQLSDLIDRGYLQIGYYASKSEFRACYKIVARIRLLTRDLLALADEREAQHVANAFGYASRIKAISSELLKQANFRADEVDQLKLKQFQTAYEEIFLELASVDAAGTREAGSFLEERERTKFGILEKFANYIPPPLERITNPAKAGELLDRLNAKLPPNTTLVEITKATSLNEIGEVDYVAFIATKTGDEQLLLSKVVLESEKTVNETVLNWQTELVTPSQDPNYRPQLGLDMREMFWQPILRFAPTSTEIYVCGTPDLSDMTWNEIPGVQATEANPTPIYLWIIVGAGLLVLMFGLIRFRWKPILLGLALFAAAAGLWLRIEATIPPLPRLGDQVTIKKYENAFDFLEKLAEAENSSDLSPSS